MTNKSNNAGSNKKKLFLGKLRDGSEEAMRELAEKMFSAVQKERPRQQESPE